MRQVISKTLLDNEIDYDTKTMASAVFKCCVFCSKQISEQLMTYPLYGTLIDPAK